MADVLRTVHVVGHLDFGGGERRTALIAQNLAARGHQPNVICLHHGGAYGEQLRAEGIPVHELNAPPKRDILYVPRMARLMRDVQPHVVDCHMSNAIWFGSLAARLGRSPNRSRSSSWISCRRRGPVR